jgi:hypothetical protein
MKQFNQFLNEKFDITKDALDELLMKTFAIVNDDVKNKYKFNRDKRTGNGHIHILSFLKKEWDDGKVSPELVYRITDMIHQIHIEDYEYPEK